MTVPQLEVELPDGTVLRANTVAEMVELRRGLAAIESLPQSTPQPAPVSAGNGSKHDAVSHTVINRLSDKKHAEELQILTIIQGQRKPILTADMMRGLGWKDENGRLGARVAGIGRICKAAGIRTEDLIVRKGSHKAGITYQAGPLLLKLDLPPVPQGAR